MHTSYSSFDIEWNTLSICYSLSTNANALCESLEVSGRWLSPNLDCLLFLVYQSGGTVWNPVNTNLCSGKWIFFGIYCSICTFRKCVIDIVVNGLCLTKHCCVSLQKLDGGPSEFTVAVTAISSLSFLSEFCLLELSPPRPGYRVLVGYPITGISISISLVLPHNKLCINYHH